MVQVTEEGCSRTLQTVEVGAKWGTSDVGAGLCCGHEAAAIDAALARVIPCANWVPQTSSVEACIRHARMLREDELWDALASASEAFDFDGHEFDPETGTFECEKEVTT